MSITTETDQGIDAAIEEAERRFAEANPRSAARQRAAAESLPGGNTRSVLHHAPFPLAFARGEAATLTSLDGDVYTDMLGEYTAGLYGHSNPVIIDALHRVLDGGISFGGHNELEQEFARLVLARFPTMDRIRFTNSGTEANLMAIATAVAATGRDGILVFEGGYHGGVLAFAGGSSPVNVPHRWVVGEYNDLEGTRELIRAGGRELAAVVVEPMLGSGGSIAADQAFMTMLREETRSAGVLLVLDEVMTSRLAPGGMQALYDVEPDLTTLGKYIGGGMSFGAFGGRADLIDRFDPAALHPLVHAGTFNNNMLTMAAGIAGLTRVLTDDSLIALNDRGDRLRDALNALFAEHAVRLTAVGQGSLLTIHPVPGPVTRRSDLAGADPRVRHLLFLELVQSGFWIAARGMIALALPITDDDCVRFVSAVERFLQRYGVLLR